VALRKFDALVIADHRGHRAFTGEGRLAADTRSRVDKEPHRKPRLYLDGLVGLAATYMIGLTAESPIPGGKPFRDVSTTRVETMLGDTGVAVHPEDERYQELVGKTVQHPFDGREVPIVADPAVERELGTGAVKLTPGHDRIDFEIAERTGLPSRNILTAEAALNDDVPEEFRGLDRYEGRERVLERLRELGSVVKEERPYVHAVGRCYRCRSEIEPWLSGKQWFVDGLKQIMVDRGHVFHAEPIPDLRLVLYFIDTENRQPYRRKAQATFVTAIVELGEQPDDVMQAGYPFLLYAHANLVILLIPGDNGTEAHFLTMEQGHYTVYYEGDEQAFFDEIYQRLYPLASSRLVINNEFRTDLEQELWDGDEITEQIKRGGRMLDELDLLPAPFPIENFLNEREMRYMKRLYGIGGLSYGNLSSRKDDERFWMSASGVDKAKLETIGRDIMLVSGFDPSQPAMLISVPREVEPRRVSVDAIEHWMIYREHPGVGAIIHVHAWVDGIASTEMNYPCGTIELAEAVAELVRREPDPAHAIIGLRNHGITVTGESIEEILQRLEGKIIPQVPMQ
jgi:ribulose-5-phosphate 4-epimerase/fuculose-1-phosphate aldolase